MRNAAHDLVQHVALLAPKIVRDRRPPAVGENHYRPEHGGPVFDPEMESAQRIQQAVDTKFGFVARRPRSGGRCRIRRMKRKAVDVVDGSDRLFKLDRAEVLQRDDDRHCG
jgi:hypothetical protein